MPRNWGPFLQRLRRNGSSNKAADDAQLKLYSQILPGGFLNYGYHEDTSLAPEKMSLEAIQRAQTRYGERLVDCALRRRAGDRHRRRSGYSAT